MTGEKITGWRNRPAAKASAGSSFVNDPVFNGRNSGNAQRQAALRALVVPQHTSINTEARGTKARPATGVFASV